ncbi:hypothetical protein C8P65_10833 [Capnocytophaga leadbetteri]|uniref:Uncharacterized protein n=2 Tax=Capnocytophaga leadbetteri TaxID=327575 RepID=A0A2T5XTN0_9FLAO|nr:hypothetical protein C8P65_10833 [Capnocytophaga leadbetteri]
MEILVKSITIICMEQEKSMFDKFISLFEKKEENISCKDIKDKESLWNNIASYTSSTYDNIVESTSVAYSTTIDFISEKSSNIYNTTAESFVEITHKAGEFYDQIEIKDNFYRVLSKVDLNSLIENLNNVEIKNEKAKNALKIVVSLLNIFDNYQKRNNLSLNTSEIIEEKQELSSEVSHFIKNIDFKEILREVRPYILYIPHPAAPIVYQLLSFLCD